MTLRDYSGTAQPTVLSGTINAAATAINVVDGTGYPLGAAGPFVITIDAGTTSEEKVLVATRTGNTFSVAPSGRGWDGTTASDHSNAASVAHTYSATDAREANAHVNDSTGDPHPQYLTPAEGAVLYSGSGHSHPVVDTTKTIRTAMSLPYLQVVAVTSVGGGYVPPGIVAAPPSQTVKLVKVFAHVENAGATCTIELRRNGTVLSGWTGITVTANTLTDFDGPDVTLSNGDRLGFYVTAIGGGPGTPVNLVVAPQLEVTV